MFDNFLYFTGCCRAALVKVNYSVLCDLIEREKKERGKENDAGVFPLIHSSETVEQVAPASFVGLLAGIYYKIVLLAIEDCKLKCLRTIVPICCSYEGL